MRYTRKVFAVCVGTAAVMVATLAQAVPASAAPIPYPYQNPGGDMTTSIALPYSASDVTAWASNILAPSFGISPGASLTDTLQAAAVVAASTPAPPSDLTGGSPAPDPADPSATAAATATVSPTSSTTSMLTVTVPASAIPDSKQAGAALLGWVAGMGAFVAAAFVVGILGSAGVGVSSINFAQLNAARPGLVKLALAAAFAAFVIASFATNDAILGISLKSAALWGGIIGYAILGAGAGAVTNPLMAWFAIKGGMAAQAIGSAMYSAYTGLANWFSGPSQAGSTAAIDIMMAALAANLPQQAQALASQLGVTQMGTGGTISNTALAGAGTTACMDGGYGHGTPVPNDAVNVNVCNGNSNQYWTAYNHTGCTESDFHNCGAATFQIADDGLCLQPDISTPNPPYNLILAWCDGSDAQLWTTAFYPVVPGIVNVLSESGHIGHDNDLCINADTAEVGQPLTEAYCNSSKNEAWDGFNQPGTGTGGAGPAGLQVAVASYIVPTDPAWSQLIAAPSSRESVLVANVLNGPDYKVNADWQKVIDQAHASGKKVIGYVDTGYFGLAGNRTTRLGSSAPADWFAQIEADVNSWYNLYGGSIDGIFFDDGYNQCGANNQYAAWYQELSDYVKRNHPGAMTVLNPGTVVPQCYDGAADVLLTYEGDAGTYINAYTSLGWTPQVSRLWHIVYGASADQIQTVVNLANQRGAGYVEITDGVLPNPYNTLPAYWTQELNTVSGGAPAITPATPWAPGGGPPDTPSGVSVTFTDYTSATLAWSPVAGASRYVINVNNQYNLEVPASMTSTTIGGLTPGGQAYGFTVSAQDPGGYLSIPSDAVTATTLALPGGQEISSPTDSQSGSGLTVSADFNVPFGFHRVFLMTDPTIGSDIGYDLPLVPHGNGVNCAPGFTSEDFSGDYMIENNTLYKYAGPLVTTGFNGVRYGTVWAWTPIGPAVPTINGHTYTWDHDWGTGAPLYGVAFEGDGANPPAYAPTYDIAWC